MPAHRFGSLTNIKDVKVRLKALLVMNEVNEAMKDSRNDCNVGSV